MQKIFLRVICILEVLLLIGAYIFNYFTIKKMGMARFVVYKNQSFENNLPIDLLIYVGVGIVCILTILLFKDFFKKKRYKDSAYLVNIFLMIVFSILFIVFIFTKSIVEMRTYYFIGFFFFIVAILQIIRTFVIGFLKK